MTNSINRKIDGSYELITHDGQKFECSRHYEKSKDKWHVRIPKEAIEICGREFVAESKFENTDSIEFATKTEHREGLSSGGWKNRMTEEERAEYEACEARMEAIKKAAMARPAKVLTEEEKIFREIARNEAKLAKLRAAKTEG